MSDCMLCELTLNNCLKHVLMEDEYAVAFLHVYPFRIGNCIISLKRHLTSISKMTEKESKSVFYMISNLSRSLEKLFDAKKVYLASFCDQVNHLHFHLIPKLSEQTSLDSFCFQRLIEDEGEYRPNDEELSDLADKLMNLIYLNTDN